MCRVFPVLQGYGWLTPRTTGAQALLVVYCILGIPLLFYMFAYLGRKLMDVIGFRIARYLSLVPQVSICSPISVHSRGTLPHVSPSSLPCLLSALAFGRGASTSASSCRRPRWASPCLWPSPWPSAPSSCLRCRSTSAREWRQRRWTAHLLSSSPQGFAFDFPSCLRSLVPLHPQAGMDLLGVLLLCIHYHSNDWLWRLCSGERRWPLRLALCCCLSACACELALSHVPFPLVRTLTTMLAPFLQKFWAFSSPLASIPIC